MVVLRGGGCIKFYYYILKNAYSHWATRINLKIVEICSGVDPEPEKLFRIQLRLQILLFWQKKTEQVVEILI